MIETIIIAQRSDPGEKVAPPCSCPNCGIGMEPEEDTIMYLHKTLVCPLCGYENRFIENWYKS